VSARFTSAHLDVVRVVALLGALAAFVLGYLTAFEDAALNIGNVHADWDYLMAMLWALILMLVISILPMSSRHKKALVFLWLVRVGVALGFMLFYEAHYGLDAPTYFREGASDPEAWRDMAFGAGTANMIGLASVHNMLIPDSYHAMKLTWSAIGLTAVFFFYRSACLLFGRADIRLLYVLGLFPSVLFWSSTLGKDPITLLGISLFVYGVLGYHRMRNSRYLLYALCGLALAAWIRVWLGMIFLLPVGVFFIMGRGMAVRKLLLAVVAVPIFVLSLSLFAERFQVETSRELVTQTDTVSQNWARGGSGQAIEGGFDSVGSMVKFMPVGAFTALFRPLPGEVLNAFGLLASAENALILGVLIWAIFTGRWRRLRSPEATWLVVTVLVWACVYGFVSYQNLGSAFRFKAQIMPLMILIGCILLEARQPARNVAYRTHSGQPP